MQDVNEYFRIYGAYETNLYNPFGPVPDMDTAESDLQKRIDHWDAHHFGVWVIATKEAPDHIIGFGGLSYKMYGDTQRINLGYRFEQQAWGKGFATELAVASIDYGLYTLKLPEIHAIVRPANAASIKVLAKSGMILSGTLDDVPGQEPSLVYQITPGNK